MSFFRIERWDQLTRRLWYIFAFIRSRFFPKSPKKKDETRRDVEDPPAKPPTTVICASSLPPPLTPIPGGDTPIASPGPISFNIRRPTIGPGDIVYKAHENLSHEHLDVDGYFLQESNPISRSPDSPIDHGSHPPVIPPRPISHHSGRSGSQYSVHRSQSQYSTHPPSPDSNRSHLSGVEVAAPEYLHAPPHPGRSSPTPSVRPGSIAGSVSSRLYRASRPKTPVPRPQPVGNAPKRRARSSTPVPHRQSVDSTRPGLPRPVSPASGPLRTHYDRPSATFSPGPASQGPSTDRLRTMVTIKRYERKVVIEDVARKHVLPPVTTDFAR